MSSQSQALVPLPGETPKIPIPNSTSESALPQHEQAAFQIVPSRTSDPDQTDEALQAAVQALVINKKRPIALEITGVGANGTRQFLIRATDQGALSHAETQIRAYAPQVDIRPLVQTDPFITLAGEAVSVYELRPGTAAYLPMRDMQETDPVRSILAALTLPPDMRATVMNDNINSRCC